LSKIHAGDRLSGPLGSGNHSIAVALELVALHFCANFLRLSQFAALVNLDSAFLQRFVSVASPAGIFTTRGFEDRNRVSLRRACSTKLLKITLCIATDHSVRILQSRDICPYKREELNSSFANGLFALIGAQRQSNTRFAYYFGRLKSPHCEAILPLLYSNFFTVPSPFRFSNSQLLSRSVTVLLLVTVS
jgi:hypothetical protein